MAEAFSPGDLVRTRRGDPPHHTRLPRYLRGATGVVLEREGEHPRADERSRGLTAVPEPVYSVRFTGAELFDGTRHHVVASMWQSYLERA
jgi:nitrile hydratase